MLTGVGARPRTRGEHAAPGSLRRRRLVLAVAVTFALAVLFVLALSQSLTSAASSDGASNILQAQEMLHGNPLLRGWWTSDVSFYTTELPAYALVLAARGLSPDVVHLCGALTYTLTVALAALFARGGVPGAAGLRRAGLAVGIMLAPSILGGTEVFLENPDHFGTSVPLLLLLLLLDWGDQPGRPDRRVGRWYVPAAACVLLAWTQVGDDLSLVAATVPVAVVCAYRLAVACVRRRPRDGLRAEGPLLAAAIVAAGVAELAEHALRALGGFDLRPLPGGRLAPLGQVPANARRLWQSIVELFGANNPGVPVRPITISQHGPLVLITYLHVIGLVLAIAGLVAGIAVGFFLRVGQAGRANRPDRPAEVDKADVPDESGSGGERVIQILVVAIVATMAAGTLGTVLQALSNTHDIAILMPLGAVLAGRTLPPFGVRLMPGRVAAVALVGWLAVGVAEMCYAATWSAAPVPVQAVADWLTAHHQRDGLAGYWQAEATTMVTGGRILVAPVTAAATGPVRWESSSRWYQPGLYRATFVIVGAHPQAQENPLQVAVARARFGPPAAEHHVGAYIIMLYRYNLLTRLHGTAFPGPS